MTDKTLSEKIWGFDYKTLTYKGMTDVTLDIVKVIISLLLIWNYPIAFSSAATSKNQRYLLMVICGAHFSEIISERGCAGVVNLQKMLVRISIKSG
jgi:hypothetical protein